MLCCEGTDIWNKSELNLQPLVSVTRRLFRPSFNLLDGRTISSLLGPILFLIYINDLENEIGSNILKFADDTKMFRRVESQEDRHQLQVYLNKLVKWAEQWQMIFNIDKCKCLHIGQANAKKNYLMNNTVLLSTERKKM